MPHTFFYHRTAGVQCQNKLRGDAQTCAAYCVHTYTHGRHGPSQPLAHICTRERRRELAQTPNTLCRAAAGVNAGVTRHVSRSILPARTGDSPRGQKWAKDGNPIPGRKSSPPASAASVIHSSCDTAAMCWGLFLRNGRVELESSRISLASVWTMNRRGQRNCRGKWKVFVRTQIKISDEQRDCPDPGPRTDLHI